MLNSSPFKLPIWLVQKSFGYWKMTRDYFKLHWVVTPITKAIPNVLCLLMQINTSPELGI